MFDIGVLLVGGGGGVMYICGAERNNTATSALSTLILTPTPTLWISIIAMIDQINVRQKMCVILFPHHQTLSKHVNIQFGGKK